MEDKGLIGMVFDLSFVEFITTRVIKIVFVIGIILSAAAVLNFIITGFATGVGRGIVMLILSPLLFLLYVLFVRIGCELIIVAFRIAENTSLLVNQGRPRPMP